MAAGGSGSAAAAVPVRDEGPLVPDEAPLLPPAGWVLRPEPLPEKRHFYAVYTAQTAVRTGSFSLLDRQNWAFRSARLSRIKGLPCCPRAVLSAVTAEALGSVTAAIEGQKELHKKRFSGESVSLSARWTWRMRSSLVRTNPDKYSFKCYQPGSLVLKYFTFYFFTSGMTSPIYQST